MNFRRLRMPLRRWRGTIDTPFDEMDYTAAQRFWSRDYVQHSVHIEPRSFEKRPALTTPADRIAASNIRTTERHGCDPGSVTTATGIVISRDRPA